MTSRFCCPFSRCRAWANGSSRSRATRPAINNELGDIAGRLLVLSLSGCSLSLQIEGVVLLQQFSSKSCEQVRLACKLQPRRF
jgi:hypothetical protein